jgi:hypothetical protein
MLSKKTIGTLLLFGFVVFLFGGGLDVLKSFQGGQQDAQLMAHPKSTGLSPVAIILYAFGFLSVLFIYWCGTNLKTNEKLAIKQFWVGLIMFWIIYGLTELLFRVGWN